MLQNLYTDTVSSHDPAGKLSYHEGKRGPEQHLPDRTGYAIARGKQVPL